MSKNELIVSSGEQGEAEPDSVFDFLYHDSRRIGSFLSQFDANGLLTGITQGEGVTKGAKRSKRFGVGAQAAILGGGNVEFEIGPGEAGSQTMERVYDPFWTNAVAFLDFLTERELIQADIEQASLGQFVLARGRLSVLDLTMFKDAWGLSTIQRAVRSGSAEQAMDGNRHERRSQGKKPVQHQSNTMPSDADLALELMGILPHTVQATIRSDADDTTWAMLRNEFMVTPPAELVLSHGSGLPGEWNMLGILNAQPDFGETELQQKLAEIAQTRLAISPDQQSHAQRDPSLIKLVVKAHRVRHAVETNTDLSIAELAEAHGYSRDYFGVLLRIAYLAPDIVAAILDGRQPVQLNRQRLARATNLPLDWQAQRAMLGFA